MERESEPSALPQPPEQRKLQIPGFEWRRLIPLKRLVMNPFHPGDGREEGKPLSRGEVAFLQPEQRAGNSSFPSRIGTRLRTVPLPLVSHLGASPAATGKSSEGTLEMNLPIPARIRPPRLLLHQHPPLSLDWETSEGTGLRVWGWDVKSEPSGRFTGV